MPATLDISLGPQLTAEQAEEIYKQGKEAVNGFNRSERGGQTHKPS